MNRYKESHSVKVFEIPYYFGCLVLIRTLGIISEYQAVKRSRRKESESDDCLFSLVKILSLDTREEQLPHRLEVIQI